MTCTPGAGWRRRFSSTGEVLAEDETIAWAHSRTGAILAQLGDLEAAEAHLRRAIELDPNLPQAHSNLGNLDYSRGAYEAALEKYKTAVANWTPTTPLFMKTSTRHISDSGGCTRPWRPSRRPSA